MFSILYVYNERAVVKIRWVIISIDNIKSKIVHIDPNILVEFYQDAGIVLQASVV